MVLTMWLIHIYNADNLSVIYAYRTLIIFYNGLIAVVVAQAVEVGVVDIGGDGVHHGFSHIALEVEFHAFCRVNPGSEV